MKSKISVAFITPWFSEGMGYSENFLPPALASHGCDVHVVSSNTQIYYNAANYRETYEPFLGPAVTETGVWQMDGYTLHRFPFFRTAGMPGIKELRRFLREINPDIIQTGEVDHTTSFHAALYCLFHSAKLFTESHRHASVFGTTAEIRRKDAREKQLNRFRPDLRLINAMTVTCYPIAPDVAEIASSFYYVPKKKIKLQSLGVETRLFHPIRNEVDQADRKRLRKELNIPENQILAIYTGRFSPDKSPQFLADAVDLLHTNGNTEFAALFVGNGKPNEIELLHRRKGSLVHSFVPVKLLPCFYRAADIGVWPREESTSQLDAAACGLPIIISDACHVKERVEGNGLMYREGDIVDLAEKLFSLRNPELRKRMGQTGSEKVERVFSWNTIARERVHDYERSLGRSERN